MSAMTTKSSPDLTRTTLGLLCLGMLIASCFLILQPFFPALIWSGTIVVATWPLMLKAEKMLHGKRSLAVFLLTGSALLVFFLPLVLAVGTIVENAGRIADWLKSLAAFSLQPPPAWLESLPFIGSPVSELWRQLAALPPEELGGRLSPYLGKVVGWFVGQAGNFGMMLLHVLLTIILTVIFYVRGEWVAGWVLGFARRVADTAGENSVLLAARAIRAVALSIIVTAVAQTFLAWFGLILAGMPYTLLLTALIFLLAVIQVGPAPVLLPAAIWLYWQGHLGWGTFLLAWSLPVYTIDNFLRPLLIKQGADLPLLLIFAGVVGGLMAFGLIGLFVGPVLLAVSYTLLSAWIKDGGLKKTATQTELPPASDTH